MLRAAIATKSYFNLHTQEQMFNPIAGNSLAANVTHIIVQMPQKKKKKQS